MAAPRHAALKNLILVNHPAKQAGQDLVEIARRVVNAAFDIKVFIVTPADGADVVPEAAWRRPTLTVSFDNPGAFVPRRGRIFANTPIGKARQAKILAAAGLPVPRSGLFHPGTAVDPAVYGPLVVLKDLRLDATSHGSVRLFPTALLNRLDAAALAARGLDPALSYQVQRFIDVGEQPSKVRVLTLFGAPLYVSRLTFLSPRPPLDADEETLAAAVIDTGAPGPRTYDFVADPEAIGLARKVAAAFPDLPLIGLDVIREAGSGRLYVLEVNAGGNTWHFSSAYWRDLHAEFPEARAKMIGMLDAFGTAARVLIERTRRHAA